MATAALVFCGGVLAVVGGSPDNGAHPYVGEAIQTQTQGGVTGVEHCSGELFSSTVFKTAAHCFPDGSQVQVTFQENGNTATQYVTGTVHTMPGFCLPCSNGTQKTDHNDIAVVVLDQPVTLPQYAQLPAVGSDASLPNNQPLTVVGYGVQAFAAQHTPSAFGTRQDGTVKLISVTDEFLKLSAAPGACNGDSGGPVLLPGTNTVVAEVSYATGNPNCNGNNYAERLDQAAVQSFIKSFE